MAGAGYKLFATGDVLTAAQVNTYLMQQTVMVFASSAARTSALSGVLAEGMVSYLQDTNTLEVYDGAAWVGATGDITALTAGTGISISSATGPVPTVTNSMATEITAKGDLIVGTGSATFDNLAAGSNGETLVADSSTTTGLRYQSAYNGNAQINGAMDVWQRGTSFSGAGLYTADRWYSGVANTTYSQESTIVPTGFQYSLKMTTTTTATAPTIWSAMETKDAIRFAGQTVTLSYYAASSDSVAAYLRLDYSTAVDTAIGGSWTNISTSTSATTATMSRVQTTFAVPSTAKSLRLIIGANAALSNGGTFCITGVQLELGSIATTFKRAGGGTIQGELSACQRYYWRTPSVTAYGVVANYAFCQNSTTIAAIVSTPVTMRTTPTAIETSNIAFINYADSVFGMSSITLNPHCNPQYITVNAAISGGTAGHAGRIVGNNNTSAYLGFSAEL